jgi:hypothetical protein
MVMKIGTRSLLFGVHQFVYHPITVALAWRKCYRQWPRWWEAVAIVCHDLGYFGKPNMDGDEGQRHPEFGADLTHDIVLKLSGSYHLAEEAYQLSLFHSTHYAQRHNSPVSRLYLPDKMSILYEPKWFYIFRSALSGEILEYVLNCPIKNLRWGQWFDWYRRKIEIKWLTFQVK